MGAEPEGATGSATARRAGTLLIGAWRLLDANADRLALIAAATIAALSFLPQETASGITVDDTLNHLIAYCGLSVLALHRRRAVPASVGTLAAVIAIGGSIELIQPWFGRAGEWSDFLANGAGALIGSLLSFGLKRAVRTVTSSPNGN